MKLTASPANPPHSDVHDLLEPFNVSALRVRLLAVVALALSPLLMLSAVQAVLEYRDATVTRRDRLAASALRAVDRVEGIIEGSQPLLEGLRSQAGVIGDDASCQNALRRALLDMREYRNVKRFESDGRVSCSALPIGDAIDDVREGGSWFEELRANAEFSVSEVFYSEISRGQVVLAAIPVRSVQGVFDGALGLSIDVAQLDALIDFSFLPEGASVAIVDGTGQAVGARSDFPYKGVDAALLEQALDDPDHVHLAADRLFPGRDLVVAPLVGDDVFVALTSPDPSLLSWARVDLIGTVLLPLTMWLMALAAIAFASDRLVLRWLEYLRRIARLYGAGRLEVEPVRAVNAPAEIAELAATMKDMAQSIKAREEELQDIADQRAALIKEVHHRVKNNLQIIVSLFNIQISSTQNESTIAALEEARGRINALALVHRSLYEAEDLRVVRLRSFLAQLLEQLAAAAGASRSHITMETEIDDIALAPEEAVPLALFVTEAAMNAFKHAFKDREGGQLRITLAHEGDGRARLDVEDDGVGLSQGSMEAPDSGVGGALMAGFARQIAGTVDTGASTLGGARVTLTFALPDGAFGT